MKREKIELLLARAQAVQEALDNVVRMDEFDEAEYPSHEDEEQFGSDGELEDFVQAIRDAQDGIEEAMAALDKCINPQDYDDQGEYIGDIDCGNDDYSDIEELSGDEKYNECMDDYQDMYEE